MAQRREDDDTRRVPVPAPPPTVPAPPPTGPIYHPPPTSPPPPVYNQPAPAPAPAPNSVPPPAPTTPPITGGAVPMPRYDFPAPLPAPTVPAYSQPRADAASTARWNAQAAMWNKYTAATNAPEKTNYTYSSGAPAGIDEKWWEDFKREHNGEDPESYYKGDLDAALRDRAWGDQFYRTYGRPPSIYDWKASYYNRKYGDNGYGGGGGGSGTAAASPTMSPMWNAIFGNYYSTRPGQSEQGYANFLSQWAQQAGRQPTVEEATRILTGYQNLLVNRPLLPATAEDFNAYLARTLAQPAALPPIAYLQLGEI